MKTDQPHKTHREYACRVAFALDPLEPELAPDPSEVIWLKNWMRDRGCGMDAVFVSHTSHTTHSPQVVEAEFTQYVRELGFSEEVKAIVLFSESSSKRKAVDLLVHYIEQAKIDFLIVSSHGRSGLNRLLMGSFSENVLAASPVPILFLNRQMPNPGSVKKILFPTDFTPASRQALDLFLTEMPDYHGELIIYHAESPPGAIADTGVLGIPVYLPENYWLDRRRYTEREAARVRQICLDHGVQARTMIHDGVVDTVAAIEAAAEQEQVDLIAMASSSRGPSLVAGNVARQVFRMHRWPVWVCGPQAL